MKLKTTILFILWSFFSYGQQLDVDSLFSVNYPVGTLEFRKAIATHTVYVERDYKDGYYGVSMSEVTFTSNLDLIEVRPINSLSENLDKSVESAIIKSLQDWKVDVNSQDTLVIYVPIVFMFNGAYNDIMFRLNTNKMIDPIAITKLGPSKKMLLLDDISNEITVELKNKNYPRVIELIDYYLMVNPFNIQIRELKISCLSKIGDKSKIGVEINIMMNYMDNKSIKDLIM